MKILAMVAFVMMVISGSGTAGAELFDFDSAPLHTSLPLSVTVGLLTAYLEGTGQSFSIQEAGVLGFTPAGFSGYSIYPNSVFRADLLISFSIPISQFSIMFAPEEYGCDTTATMRVTAYMDTVYVGTNTASAPQPGTWPTGVLSYSNAQGFNRVVVHYDAQPAFGCDWGPVFMADNMEVVTMPTPLAPSTWGQVKHRFTRVR